MFLWYFFFFFLLQDNILIATDVQFTGQKGIYANCQRSFLHCTRLHDHSQRTTSPTSLRNKTGFSSNLLKFSFLFMLFFFYLLKFELRPGFLYIKCRFTFPARLLQQSYNNRTRSAGQGLQFVTTIIFFIITCFFQSTFCC